MGGGAGNKMHFSGLWLWSRGVRGITRAGPDKCVLGSQELTLSRPDFSVQRTEVGGPPEGSFPVSCTLAEFLRYSASPWLCHHTFFCHQATILAKS